MILYDQNYNFLGISNETVSFLGYEDLEEFTSLHSDFANLLVPKDGSIYKFKNFSWIDFILYSGAPNKAAIVKLKNGDEIDIKLTVKEIFFAKDFNGLEKCYAVRIISDKFVHIASKVDASLTSEAKSGVDLSNLISETQLNEPKSNEEIPTIEKEEIVLNFNAPSDTTEVEEEIQEFDSKNKEEKIVLDLTKETKTDNDIENKSNFNLNFLSGLGNSEEKEKEKEKEKNQDVKNKDKEKKSDSFINLNFLKNSDTTKDEKQKEDTQIPQPTLTQKPSLDFLKTDSNDLEEVVTENSSTSLEQNKDFDDTSEFKLKFKHEDTDDKKEEYPPLNKEEIIKQIKDDITEIDEEDKEKDIIQPFKETLSTITTNKGKEDKEIETFEKNNLAQKEINPTDITETDLIEDEDLIYDFIYDSKSNITLLKSFLFDENYKKALYPIAKMQTSADILNLNDIISSLNSIKSSTKSMDKESILNHINILEKKLNILKSKIKGEAAFS